MNSLHNLETEESTNIRTVIEAAENRKYYIQTTQKMTVCANGSTELPHVELISSGPSVAKLARGRIHIPRASQRDAMCKVSATEQLTSRKKRGGKSAREITGFNRMP